MEILLINLHWMTINVTLAIIPVIFGELMLRMKNKIVKSLFFAVWFFFLPNTIYLITDPINLFRDAKYLDWTLLGIDTVLYAILLVIGVATFILCLNQFELLLGKKVKKRSKRIAVFGLNLLVGFGLVLGRFLRVNSWEVVTDPLNVINKSIEIITTPQWIFWLLLFAIVSQVVYVYFGSFAKDRHKSIAA